MKREQGWHDFCIAGWNVGGSIERKLNDQEVCHRLRRYDFIFIAETHTKREWRLDLMDDFFFPERPIRWQSWGRGLVFKKEARRTGERI